jgi:hypothetical protein
MIELHKGGRFFCKILSFREGRAERGVDTFILELEQMPSGDFHSSFYELVNGPSRTPVNIKHEKYGTKDGIWVKCYRAT